MKSLFQNLYQIIKKCITFKYKKMANNIDYKVLRELLPRLDEMKKFLIPVELIGLVC